MSYYGANIYPEHVMVGLEQSEVTKWITGKFVLETKEIDSVAKYMHIAVELLPGIQANNAMKVFIAEFHHPDPIITLEQ